MSACPDLPRGPAEYGTSTGTGPAYVDVSSCEPRGCRVDPAAAEVGQRRETPAAGADLTRAAAPGQLYLHTSGPLATVLALVECGRSR